MTAWLRVGLLFAALCFVLPYLSERMTPVCAGIDAPHDTAVVLGAGIEKDGTLARDSAIRVDSAAALYTRGIVRQVHVTGGGEVRGVTVGAAMAALARDLGIPDAALSVEDQSRSTLENALLSLPALAPEDRLLLVTEPYHALRGQASFAWAGRSVAACASDNAWSGADLWRRARLREGMAWGLNLVRAPVWLLADAVGMADHLPTGFLK